MANHIPVIEPRVACIVDKEARVLTAVISSHLFASGRYLPIFLFPRISSPKIPNAGLMSEGYVADLIGTPVGHLIGNAVARMGSCEYLVLAGLDEHQKTFLRIPPGLKIIEITDCSQVESNLTPLLGSSPKPELRCKTGDVLSALYIAQREGKRLVIDEAAETYVVPRLRSRGVVVVENVPDASPVIAINYASSMRA